MNTMPDFRLPLIQSSNQQCANAYAMFHLLYIVSWRRERTIICLPLTHTLSHLPTCFHVMEYYYQTVVLKSDGTTGQTTGQPKPVNWPIACHGYDHTARPMIRPKRQKCANTHIKFNQWLTVSRWGTTLFVSTQKSIDVYIASAQT